MQKQALAIATGVALALTCGVGFSQQAPATRATQTAPASTPAAAPDAASHPGTLGAQAIVHRLTQAGYTDVHKLEFKHGLWKAKAIDHGRRVKLHVNAATGAIYPGNGLSKLSAQDVRAKLDAADYRNIREVEFDDGMWKAHATDPSGQRVKLRIAPDDGSVVGIKFRHH